MNHALLGKWPWRLQTEKGALWNRLIKSKYGRSEGGWWTKDSSVYRASAVWKGILSSKSEVIKGIGIIIGKGDNMCFWEDIWVGDSTLKRDFPNIFRLSTNQSIHVADCFSTTGCQIVWNPMCRRNLLDWEIDEYAALQRRIIGCKIDQDKEDSLHWRIDKSGSFTGDSSLSLYQPYLDRISVSF
ncbi:uncharacterized protein LOC131219954 [Magnolia sinica]|uniref:uncharacterized protein LOC131219954 n=1 Tax=Magnolia sinica TaxID=86752 RepID=UPI002659A968|nr:uncharacterized protein LOC131219954 [Magnolia sinica]